MKEKQFYVYIMTNKNNTVLYTGVTSDLKKRVYEHKAKLVYYEVLEDPENAILREKQIKAGSRKRKIKCIEAMNKGWDDLYEKI